MLGYEAFWSGGCKVEQHPETVAEEVEIKRSEHEQWLDYREISEGFSGGRLDGWWFDGWWFDCKNAESFILCSEMDVDRNFACRPSLPSCLEWSNMEKWRRHFSNAEIRE